jgi:hypothetical protein
MKKAFKFGHTNGDLIFLSYHHLNEHSRTKTGREAGNAQAHP